MRHNWQWRFAALQIGRNPALIIIPLCLTVLLLWPALMHETHSDELTGMPELARYVALGAQEDQQLTALAQGQHQPEANTATKQELHADMKQLGPLITAIKTNDDDRNRLAQSELAVLHYFASEQSRGRMIPGFSSADCRKRITELQYVLQHHYRLQLSGDSRLGAINQLTRTLQGETPFVAIVVVLGLWMVSFILPEKRTRQRAIINLSPVNPGGYYFRRGGLFGGYAGTVIGIVFMLSLAGLTKIFGWGNSAYPLVGVTDQRVIVITHSGVFVFRYLLLTLAFMVVGVGLGALSQVLVKDVVTQSVVLLTALLTLSVLDVPKISMTSSNLRIGELILVAGLAGGGLLLTASKFANWQKRI